MRHCECGHHYDTHCGFFGDCIAREASVCDCRWFVEAPRFHYLRRLWAWLKAVPR